MITASATVNPMPSRRATSIRWPPITIASNTAPTFDMTMMRASTEMEPLVALRNCAGTPAEWASPREKNAIGIRPATESAKIAVQPVLSNWLAFA
jgi:hypothetical protein